MSLVAYRNRAVAPYFSAAAGALAPFLKRQLFNYANRKLTQYLNTPSTRAVMPRTARRIVRRTRRVYKPKRFTRKKTRYVKRRRRRRTFKRRRKGLRSKVFKLQKQVATSQGLHVERQRNTGRLTCLANQMSLTHIEGVTTSDLENVISALKHFDPDNPSTLRTVDYRAGSFQKKIYFKSAYGRLNLKNNFKSRMKATIYVIIPKVDGNDNGPTAFTNGLADVGSPSNVSPLVHVTDSPIFNERWKIIGRKTKYIAPGGVMSMSYCRKNFCYDPSWADDHNLTYLKASKTTAFMVRLEGELAHDNAVSTEQGQSPAYLDYQLDRKYIVDYDAGADIKNIKVTDNSSSFTNNAEIGVRVEPVQIDVVA